MEGYIKLHRRILDNPLSNNMRLFYVWMHLLLRANHQNSNWIYNFQKIPIKKGQCVISQRKLAQQIKVNSKTLNRIIHYLKSEMMIETQTDRQYTLITILNWDKYQNNEAQNETPLRHKVNTKVTQSKTNKNDKNDKNINIDQKFNIFWNSYPRKIGRSKCLGIYLKLIEDHPNIINGLNRALIYWKKQATQMQYIPHPATWLNQKRWEDEYSSGSYVKPVMQKSTWKPPEVNNDPAKMAEARKKFEEVRQKVIIKKMAG